MAQQVGTDRIGAADVEDRAAWLASELDRTAHWGLWALPVWTVLLLLGRPR